MTIGIVKIAEMRSSHIVMTVINIIIMKIWWNWETVILYAKDVQRIIVNARYVRSYSVIAISRKKGTNCIVMTAMQTLKPQKGLKMKIEQLLMSKENQIFNLIRSEMGEGIEGDNYLWYPSNSPLLFQAHIDTVRDESKPIKLSVGQHVVTAEGILGADDRAGICIAMWIAAYAKKHSLQMPQFLFTNKEETGGIGMKQFLDCEPDLTGVNLAIALDRRGASEYVYYNRIATEVKEYIEHFGFIEEYGTFSDIELFSERTRIPSVNISVGYYHQHTKHEQLNIDEMRLTLRRCAFIISDPLEKLYPVKEKKYGGRGYVWASYDDYVNQRDNPDETVELCEWCNYEQATKEIDWYGSKVYVCRYCEELIMEELIEEERKGEMAYA